MASCVETPFHEQEALIHDSLATSCSNSSVASGFHFNSGSHAVSITFEVTFHGNLEPPQCQLRAGMDFFQIPTNINILTSSQESQMFFMAYKMVNSSRRFSV